jgi:DNA-binding NtrC family response regulator
MERAVLLCTGDEILSRHLPERMTSGPAGGRTASGKSPAVSGTLQPGHAPPRAPPGPMGDGFPESQPTLRFSRDEHEREIIREALRRANGNQTRAARLLGIARSTLVKRIEKYGLPRPRKTEEPGLDPEEVEEP